MGRRGCAREGACHGFRLRLVAVTRDMSTQGYNALLTIPIYGNRLQAGLIERSADVIGNTGQLIGVFIFKRPDL